MFPKYEKGKREWQIIECSLTPFLTAEDIEACKIEAGKMSRELWAVASDFHTVPEKDAKIMEKRFKRFKKKELS